MPVSAAEFSLMHLSCRIQFYACQRCRIQSYVFKLQNSVLCLVLVVVICVTRVYVELILTEVVGNVGGFVILIVGFCCIGCCQLLLAVLEGARQFYCKGPVWRLVD